MSSELGGRVGFQKVAPEGEEGAAQASEGRGHSRCKGPEASPHLPCLRSSKEATVAEAEPERGPCGALEALASAPSEAGAVEAEPTCRRLTVPPSVWGRGGAGPSLGLQRALWVCLGSGRWCPQVHWG